MGAIVHTLTDKKAYRLFGSAFVKAINLTNAHVVEYSPVHLAFQVGKWQYQYAKDIQKAVPTLENVVTLIDQGDKTVQQNQSWHRSMAARFLSLIYLDLASEYRASGGDPSQIIEKIRNLALDQPGSNRYYRASEFACILGFCLREFDCKEQDEWRACIRPSMTQALDLLSDENPLNDQKAYCQLGQALLAAGDIPNGMIAYGVTLRPLEDRRKELAREQEDRTARPDDNNEETSANKPDANKQETNIDGVSETKTSIDTGQGEESQTQNEDSLKSGNRDDSDDNNTAPSAKKTDNGRCIAQRDREMDEKNTNGMNENEDAKGRVNKDKSEDEDHKPIENESLNPKYQGFRYSWFCDGPCDTPDSDYVELWFCQVCGTSCFCEKCIHLHRQDKLWIRNCASDHPLIRMYPIAPEAIELTDALIERRFDKQEKWLEQIRKAWEE